MDKRNTVFNGFGKLSSVVLLPRKLYAAIRLSLKGIYNLTKVQQRLLYARDWRRVLCCDESYWMASPRYPKNVKHRCVNQNDHRPSNTKYEKEL